MYSDNKNELRICLDLNIWCASLLAEFKGRKNTSCQLLVNIVRLGYYEEQKVKLVISWGMLNRLKKVLEKDLKISQETSNKYIDLISKYANNKPQLTLGGSGIIPLKDIEDGHVLETAIAGKVNFLVTANFSDFMMKETEIIIPERYAIYNKFIQNIKIVHPYLMIHWFQENKLN